jgi:hypothetical protein
MRRWRGRGGGGAVRRGGSEAQKEGAVEVASTERRKMPLQGGRSAKKNETKVTHSQYDRSRRSRDRGPICML